MYTVNPSLYGEDPVLHCRPLLRPNYRGSALNHHTGGGGGLGVHTQCVTHVVVVSLAKASLFVSLSLLM